MNWSKLKTLNKRYFMSESQGGWRLDDIEKELTDMPIWQNHEQRITTLEVTTANIKNEFTEIKDKIDRGNTEQSKKLEIIDKRIMEENFKRKKKNNKSEERRVGKEK